MCEYLKEGADKDKAIPDEFNVYMSSNGKNYYTYGLPSDTDKRENKWKYNEVIEATKKRRGKLWKWFFVGLIGFSCLGAIHYLIGVFGVIGLIILLIIIKKVKYDRVINEAERLIKEMEDDVTAIRDEFKKSSSKIHGFEECAVKK